MAQVGAEYIFNELSMCFAIEHSVLQVIVDQLVDQTLAMKLNKLTIQPIFKQLRKSCPKSNLAEMNILFKCCYVLIVSLRESNLLMHDMEELFMDYPEFRGLPADELKKLLKFRNAMKMSLQLIEAKHHKGELLDICGRLSGKLVTTGGSQTTETKRRVMIYEREGGLEEKSVLKGKKRKGDFDDVKIKEEVFSPSSKKACPLEAGPLLSRNVAPAEQTICGRVIKPEPSLLPAPVAAFVTQQLNHKFSASDAATYMSIIEKTVIQTTTNKELNKLTLRPILKELRKLFPRKEIWAEMNILFKCCYVLMLSLRDDSLLWLEQRQFLENYRSPEFQNLTSDEVQKLMVFRNAMKLSLQLIEAKHHKGELLEIAGRLSGRVVTTGGGQTLDTTRCVMIYEQEGGNYSERIERKPFVATEHTGHAGQVHEEHSAFEFEGICRLESMRNDEFLGSQFSQQDFKPACLERAASTASLMASFSLQSNDAFALFKDFSVGNLLSDPCLSLSGLTPTLTMEAHISSKELQEVHLQQDMQRPSTSSSKHTASSVTITAVHREGDTDIDTELDSVEVATDVDENEHHMDELDEDTHPEGENDKVEAPYCDARELYEMLRSQSMPLESQEYQYGLGMSQRGLSGIGGIGQAGKTDSVSSVDMCMNMGIARLGSLPTISPDMFGTSSQ